MTAADQTRTDASGVASLARAVGWLVLLAAAHAGLTAAGRTLPAPPAPWPPDEFVHWLEANDAVRTTFALLRIVGLVTVWYLAAVTVLVLIARVLGLRPLARLAHAVAMPWARRLVNHALGAGLALTLAGGVVPVAGATVAAARPAPATAEPAHDDGPVTMRLLGDDDAPDRVVTMHRLPDEPDTAGETQLMRRGLARATVSMHRLDEQAEPAPSWTIAPGDHLWHVAAITLRAHWQRDPTDAEITGYWRALIDHNRGRFAVPGDPDLVYPGQVFELPPVPAPGP